MSGLGAYDNKVYAALITGEDAERVKIGWTIMYKTYSLEQGVEEELFKWRLGYVVHLSTTGNRPGDISATVRFPSVEGAPELSSIVILTRESFGDGTAVGHYWFRIIKRTELVAHQKSARARAVFEHLQGALGRVKVPEKPCGQCGHRAIGRALSAERGNRIPDELHVGPAEIFLSRQLVGGSLMKNAVAISKIITHYDHRTRQQTPEALAKNVEYLTNRGREVQLVNPNLPCDSKDWFGGHSGCDAIAASMGSNKKVFTLTEGQMTVNVFEPDGMLRHTSIREMDPTPGDIVMESVWRGTHFESWVVKMIKSHAEIEAEEAAAAAAAAAAVAAAAAATAAAAAAAAAAVQTRTRAAAAAAAAILEAAAVAAARKESEDPLGSDGEAERIKKAKFVDARQKTLANLPSSDDLMLMYTRIQQWKEDVLARGKQGRHNQWITAKLRLINEKIIPALSAGKSMTAEDEYLIFKTNNSRKKQGMSKAEFDKMEAWAKELGGNCIRGNSKKGKAAKASAPASDPSSVRMLSWASLGPLLRDRVACGRPNDFKFSFGVHKNKTLIEVLSEGNMSYVYWYIEHVAFNFPDHFMLFYEMKRVSGRLFKRKTFLPGVVGFVFIDEAFQPEAQNKWRLIKAAYKAFKNDVLKPVKPCEAPSDSSEDDLDINGYCTSHLELLIGPIPCSARVVATSIDIRALPSLNAQTISTIMEGEMIHFTYQKVVHLPGLGPVTFLQLGNKGWIACKDKNGSVSVDILPPEATVSAASRSDARHDRNFEANSDSNGSRSDDSGSFQPNSDSSEECDDIDPLDPSMHKAALVLETDALKADGEAALESVLEQALNEAFPDFEIHQQRQERSQNRIEKVLSAVPSAVRTPAELIAHCAAIFSGLHSDDGDLSSGEAGFEGDDDCDSTDSEDDEYDPCNVSGLHATVSPAQVSFVQASLRQRPDFSAWASPWIPAPDPRLRGSGLDHTNPASWLQTPSFLCSPSNQFQHLGVTQIPCAGCRDFGEDPFHEDVSVEAGLRMRNVRGISHDFCLVGQRARCKRCERRRRSVKSSLRSAQETFESISRIAELKAALKNNRSGRFTTYDSDMLIILAERFPFLYNWVPAVVTHRSAVSSELLSFSVYSLKTPLGFHGIEALLLEMRQTCHWLHRVLPYYSLAVHMKSHRKTTIPYFFEPQEDAPITEITLHTAPLSDTLIAHVSRTFVEYHAKYMRQFTEQIAIKDSERLAVDHHLKSNGRSGANSGAIHLSNVFTGMIGTGVVAQSVFTESTGTNDPSLQQNCAEFSAALKTHGHPRPRIIVVDNPHRDIPGLAAAYQVNTSACTDFKFDGTVIVISETDEGSVDAAVLRLREQLASETSLGFIGFDTENVAYVNGNGTSSSMAATVQLCAGADFCYVFVVHAFTDIPKSLYGLFDDPDVPMVCVEPGHDVNYLSRRFQSLSWEAPPSFPGVIDICRITSALISRPRSLGEIMLSYTGRVMNKYIDHRFWENVPLTKHQIAYASNDAFAHLTAAACSASCIMDKDGALTLQVAIRSADFKATKNSVGEVCVLSSSLSGSVVLQQGDVICAVSADGFSAKVLASSVGIRAFPSFAAERLSDASQNDIIHFDCRRVVTCPDRGAVIFFRLIGEKGWIAFSDERSGSALLQIIVPEKADCADAIMGELESASDVLLCLTVNRSKVTVASKIGAQNRVATYRHEKPPPSKRVVDEIAVEVDPDVLDDVNEDDEVDGDEDGSNFENEAIPKRVRPPAEKIARNSAAADEALAASMSSILAYVKSERTDDLTLTTKFSSEDRKILHSFCSEYGLYHRSFGPEGDRAIVIRRWSPFESFNPMCGEESLGYQVGKPLNSSMDRGFVESYNNGNWTLVFVSGEIEVVDLDTLNSRIRFRYDTDSAIMKSQREAFPPPGHRAFDFEKHLKALLDGCDEDWNDPSNLLSYFKYDARHFLACFGNICAASKNTPLFRWFIVQLADALAVVVDGWHEKVKDHFKFLGMNDDRIKHVKRSGWRRLVMTHQPEPKILVRRLWDVLTTASRMKDPERTGHDFFVPDWLSIANKELKYVQLGLLSDPPNFPMYEVIGYFASSLPKLRCRRQSSDLEAYHQHKSRAVSVHARGAGAEYHDLREGWFDWVWNIRALVKARRIPDPGTSWLWIVDIVSQVLRNVPEDLRPVFFQVWPSTNTSLEPILNRGVYPDLIAPTPLPGEIISELISSEHMRKVLEFPELCLAGDASSLLRATGIAARPTRLLEIAKRATEFASIYQQLQDNQAAALRVRLSETDNGAAPLPLRLATIHRQMAPSEMPIPAFLGVESKSHRHCFFGAAPMNASPDPNSATTAQMSKFSKYRKRCQALKTPEQKEEAKVNARRRKQKSRLAAFSHTSATVIATATAAITSDPAAAEETSHITRS